VFSELFAQETGHEIYLRDPRRSYGITLNKPMRYAELCELARKRGETLIGFVWQNRAADVVTRGGRSKGGIVSSAGQLLGTQAEVHLAVNADTEVQLREGDKLVVLALE
jgi:hypothetical protein